MSSDEIKAKFGGKWKAYKSENFDEFLKAVGKFCLTFLFTLFLQKRSIFVILVRLACSCLVLTILNKPVCWGGGGGGRPPFHGFEQRCRERARIVAFVFL